MPITCPACKKINENQDVNSCPRCGCDLSSLWDVSHQAAHHLALAAVCLRNLDWPAAFSHASRSWSLIPDPAAARAAFLAAIALPGPRPQSEPSRWLNRALLNPRSSAPHPPPPQSNPIPPA